MTNTEDRLTRNLSVKPIVIPHIKRATMGMIASQYDIPYETLGRRYRKHKNEFANDAVLIKSFDQFENMLPPEIQFASKKEHGVTNYMFANAAYVGITPGKTLLFNENGIHHLIELASTHEKRGRKPSVKYDRPKVEPELIDISETKSEFSSDKEETLLLNIARAYKTGEIMNLLTAAMALDSYRQREIRALKDSQAAIANTQRLPWTNRTTVKMVVNTLVEITGSKKYDIWVYIYRILIDNYHIPLDTRDKKPMITGLKDEEWHLLYQAIVDICRERYLNVDQILAKSGVDATGLSIMVKY